MQLAMAAASPLACQKLITPIICGSQLFYSALNTKGRAGFVMANSASDARASGGELRRKLIEARAVDV